MSAPVFVEPDPPSDAELDQAYGRLIDTQWPRLIAMCLVFQCSRAEAEDIVGEAFARLYERRHTVAAPAPYLRKTVLNLLNRRRRRREHPSADLETVCATPGESLDLAEVEDSQTIHQALQQLPHQQRRVFRLHLQQMRDIEIADVLGMKKATVRSHLRHARTTLEAWWQAEGKDRR